MPPASLQIRNAAAAAFRIVGAAVAGDVVPAKPETITQRQAICLGTSSATACEHCVLIQKGETVYHRCAQCGCWLDGKFFAKLKLATESCPLGKWSAENQT